MSRDPDLTQYSADDHRVEWAKLDFRDRRRIMKAVNRAQALDDPGEARIAVGAARGQQRFWRWSWLIGVPIGLLQYRQGTEAMLVNLSVALIILGGMSLLFRRRARKAEQLNLEVWASAKGGAGHVPDGEAGSRPETTRPHYDEWKPNPNTSKAKQKRRKKRR